jgi:WD40 repeat protein
MRHEGAVSVGISPDGQTIATGRPGTKRPSTRLWQADTGRLLREFAAGGKVRFSPDGRYLAIADGGVHVMELSTGEDWTFDYGIRCIGWSPDGRFLAACDEFVSGGGQYTPTVRYGNVRIWSVASRTVEFTFQTASGPHDATFSPDGRWLATIGNFRAQLWDLASRGPGVTVPRLLDIEITMPWSATTPAVCFSPDGRWLAAGSARQVQLWQLAG